MSVFSILYYCLFLTISKAVVTKYTTTSIDSASIFYQPFFMYDKNMSPAINARGDKNSYLELQFDTVKNNPSFFSRGVVEVFFGSEEFFNTIGYIEGGKKVLCCDENAANQGFCTDINHLIVKKELQMAYEKKEIEIPNSGVASIYLHYDIPVEGKYYMVMAMCDISTTNFNITGETVAVNPYGHLPGRIYGLLPFTRYVVYGYLAISVYWIWRCIRYRTELMIIHYLVFFALCIFSADTIIHFYSLSLYNAAGYRDSTWTLLSILISAFSRSFGRGIILLVVMGLGVTHTSLSKELWKVILLCFVYCLFSLWDSFTITYSDTTELNMYCLIPLALVDTVIYVSIFLGLNHTIDQLVEKKQSLKVTIFYKLRVVMILVVLMTTVYNTIYSNLVMQKRLDSLWKWQWFFNEGVWMLFYFTIFCTIVYLWAPSEHMLDYAYRVQVSTEEVGDIVHMEGSLQPETPTENVRISPIGPKHELKPMKI